MAVYRHKYKDPKTGEVKQSKIWWYDFTFAGRRIQESTKSSLKTIAVQAEKVRRRELEQGFNQIEDNRRDRIRSIAALAAEFLEGYGLRNPRSSTYATYALGHVTRMVGKMMVVDVSEETVKKYYNITAWAQ